MCWFSLAPFPETATVTPGDSSTSKHLQESVSDAQLWRTAEMLNQRTSSFKRNGIKLHCLPFRNQVACAFCKVAQDRCLV